VNATRSLLAAWILSAAALAAAADAAAEKPALWLTIKGGDGPGKGKHVVLVSGDEEYRSEEALPQLAKILARRHGFDCTVLFAIDSKTGLIDPNVNSNIPGLEALDRADLMVIATRFRNLPDEQMKHVVDYVESGRPIIGMRTATHAFAIPPGRKYAKYDWQSKDWPGGFGRQVLGETWVDHHGQHGRQSTRGLVAPGAEGDPILRGIKNGDVWGPTDVYAVHLPLPGDSKVLVLGEVLAGMASNDPPVKGRQNDPMMPVAWTRTYKGTAGKAARVFATTMGAATDLQSEGLRRLLVNACYWAVGRERRIPAKADAALVGEYQPTAFGFNGFVKGRRPADYK
jgi:type 1 glutamine amidotransferase